MLQIVKKKENKVWWEVGTARGLFNGPWVVCGDFNTVRFPFEKKNCSRITKSMTDLSDFIEDMNLLDLQLAGESYTWRKGDKHDIAVRLDRSKLLGLGCRCPIQKEFEDQEIWDSVKLCARDKAPGPDGLKFYHGLLYPFLRELEVVSTFKKLMTTSIGSSCWRLFLKGVLEAAVFYSMFGSISRESVLQSILSSGNLRSDLLLRKPETDSVRGKGIAAEKTSDIEVYKEGAIENVKSHVASGSGDTDLVVHLNETQAQGVYSPHTRRDKAECWEVIATIKGMLDGPWCCNTSEWEKTFSDIRQNLLRRANSDHTPIPLECGNWIQKRSYFTLENWWLGVKGFKEQVQKWFSKFEVQGCLDFKLGKKLRLLNNKLKEWSRSNFGVLVNKKNSLLNDL
ncbi:hypothetical protein MTR67_039961 [Solanum verrucosum]|uniref:Reverse transcriptase n=1 Tax=Solanum verrucosum TaxID=315347 RepID=A0AAF0ZPD0_SOLVR|nr:hypothetical protein MTR67_039961 [Solanum verrucosum]